MREPVAVSRYRVLRQEYHHIPAGHFHGPVPALRSRRFGDLDQSGQGKLTDDVPGAVRRAQVRAHDLEGQLPLAHDPVQDGAEGAAGVEGRDHDRDRERRVAHHAV